MPTLPNDDKRPVKMRQKALVRCSYKADTFGGVQIRDNRKATKRPIFEIGTNAFSLEEDRLPRAVPQQEVSRCLSVREGFLDTRKDFRMEDAKRRAQGPRVFHRK